MTYFGNISRGIKTSLKGLSLTWKHLWAARKSRGAINVENSEYFSFTEGHVTLQYPHEMISVPDHGRYQLDCEIDDCIVCDKCAKVCPVNCIEIEAVKSSELIRYTSDGSPVRLHAAKFDIDMAKCCFCGLCTTVCPTECLTMNSEYDYSVLDIRDLNFAFSNLTPEEAEEKKQAYAQFVAEKAAAKVEKTAEKIEAAISERPKPKFVPKAKPAMEAIAKSEESPEEEKPKPKFVPKAKPATAAIAKSEESPEEEKPKAKFVPKAKPATAAITKSEETPAEEEKPKPKFVPKIKPATGAITKSEETPAEEEKPKPKFIPKIKPS